MKNPYVDAIAHSGNPKFPIDIERFVSAAKEEHVLIEINNSSFTSQSREGSTANCVRIAKFANDIGANIVAGSDAHICYDLGKFDKVLEVFNEIGVNEELVVNTSIDKLKEFLRKNGKEL
jgi:putative hydrolase